jgi:8-oxo-dGTP pyrophosphatase MutT (NUDIX family)
MDWPALRAANAHDPASRVPFFVERTRVGSVARAHLPALAAHGSRLRIGEDEVVLEVAADRRDGEWAALNLALRDAGLIVAWRDETYAVLEHPAQPALARIERAASRFWGTLTFGAHCTGYVVDANGRPGALWIARRSLSKPTDPGLFDNLVGGGVPAGQAPFEALVREGWEEAGLGETTMRRATPGRVLRLHRDIPEGFQHEWLYAYDLALSPDEIPCNQDGEVMDVRLLPVAEALAIAASDAMTVDAALVTLDFALRHRLLPAPAHAGLRAALEPLLVDSALTVQGI